MLIQMNFGPPITDWNNYADGPSIRTLFSDLLDSSGNSTGIAMRSDLGGSYTASDRADGDYHGLPEAFWDNLAFRSSGGMQFTFSGLTPYIGQDYSMTTAHFSNSARDNDVTFDGATQQYNSVTGNPVVPLTFTGTVSSDTLVLNIDLVSGTTTTYFQGFTLDIGASLPAITNIDGDDNVYRGQTPVTINTTNFPSSVTTWSADISGEALTKIGWNSGNPQVTIPVGISLYAGNGTLNITYTE